MAIKSRRVLITGGGSGIGLALARRFSDEKYDVTVAGRTEATLAATGLPFVKMDVTDEISVTAAVEKTGAFDVVIANAGGAMTAPALKTSLADWNRMIALNLTSVYLCARATAPAMTKNGWGRFIAIASTAAVKGYPYVGAYAAAKHGVLGWIRTLALELAPTGVTANAICPGYTDTPLIENAVEAIVQKTGRDAAEASKTFTQTNPMGRLVAPEEVAATALWLASDAGASVNGQAIVIDGGETAG